MKNYEDTDMDRFRKVAKMEITANSNRTGPKSYVTITNGLRSGLENYVSQEYIDRMAELSEKYQNIKWLPLAVPKFQLDDIPAFITLWDKKSRDILRINSDVGEPWSKEDHPLGENSSWYRALFKGLTLWSNPHRANGSFYHNIYTGKDRQVSRIIDQVFEFFPMHTIWEIYLWESTMPVGPHRDIGDFWKCPTEFRAMVYDENIDPTFYVVDIEKGDKNYIDCPPDTNSFCWSNGTQIHGSDYFNKRKIILCVSGVQHSDKTSVLLEKSLEKYQSILNYKL
jgi:hypothetical protein